MSKTIANILHEVKNRGELNIITLEKFKVRGQFGNKFQALTPSDYNDFDAFTFEKRLYVRYNGGWYDGTNHPMSPFPEWRDSLNAGYHLKKIEKRDYGSFGKIMEELEELNDAHEQGSKIMQLVELADLYGAIEGYLQERFPGMEMHDLKKFSDITKRAFKNGHRG